MSLIASLPAIGTERADYYRQIPDSTSVNPFNIALWVDPDLLVYNQQLQEKIRRFGNGLLDEASAELKAANFGFISIEVLNDYERLLEERKNGIFELLHCDQAVYLAGRSQFDLYEVLLEQYREESPSAGAAGIWVREDSEIKELGDLVGRHIAAVHSYSLLGGALQQALLAVTPRSPRPGEEGNYKPTKYTNCGSASDAILRLITGVATERPIEAAFIPTSSPGLSLAARLLGVDESGLPIELLETHPNTRLPGKPLLVSGLLKSEEPALVNCLKTFLVRQRVPYKWQNSGKERFVSLEHDLAVAGKERE